MIGQTISHYQILEKLGEGGMGVVYKAQDTKLDRLVALKFLPSHVSGSEQDKARFVQEAKAAAALNRPNICTIYGIEDNDGQMFIAMEFVEGDTLRAKGSNVPFKQAIEIGIQIADGLAAAHEKGIVHRDLKPENIMIQKDGRVKIMDFGLAKLKGASPLTKAGSTVGTAGYMSPEQVQGLETDHRTDIFSLGVILYELLSGQSPFKGVHETALNYEIVNVEPDPISTVKPDIDPDLDVVVLDCMAKDVRDRCQSVAEVARDLRRFKRESSRARVSRVTAVRPAQKFSEVQPVERIPKKLLGRDQLPWAIATVVFFLLGYAVATIYFGEVTEVRVTRASILPPEKTTFVATGGGHIALSPDGRTIAFVARDSSGNAVLWVRSLNALSAQPLRGTEGAQYPFWSPDSRFLGFFAAGKLKKIEASGGPGQTICDAPEGRGGTWNRDGVIVFAAGFNAPLSRVSAAGGVPSLLRQLDSTRSEISHRWPHFLPDGHHFLYVSRTLVGGTGEGDAIYAGSLDSTMPHKVVVSASSNMAYAAGQLLFMREQALMSQPFDIDRLELMGEAVPVAEQVQYDPSFSRAVFSVSENGVLTYQTGLTSGGRQLVWFDRSGKVLGTVGKPAEYFTPRLSPDGRRLAVDLFDPQSRNIDVWLCEITRNVWTRFTFDPGIDRDPAWSPDGSRIVFRSNRSGRFHLYQRASSGEGSEEILFESNDDKVPTSWSMDGRFLAYHTPGNPKTLADLWVLPLKAQEAKDDRKPILFLQTDFNEVGSDISPDGRWIAYSSNESGRSHVYVRPFPGPGGKYQVSTTGGLRPRWRLDGKELFYLADDNKMMAAEVKAGGATFEVGQVRPLFQTHPFLSGAAYDVTADGQRFLVNTIVGEESSPITLVVNWPEELKKK